MKKNQQNFDQQLNELEKQLADIFDKHSSALEKIYKEELNDSSNGYEKAKLNIEYSLIQDFVKKHKNK